MFRITRQESPLRLPAPLRALFIIFLACLLTVPAFGQSGADPASFVRHQVLDNGLEVFVNRNRAVPLATIMITFRCGALSQDPSTAGLFHLYEHMLFAGNAAYPDQSSFMAALNRMGVSNWNGGTSTEYVNYYITLPSDRLAEGLAFWAAAVREPLFDPAQLEREKEVVINEIRGYHSDPADVFGNAVSSRAFAAQPWRKDISGSEANIRAATVEKLRSIQRGFYIPSNAALMIGGDVDPDKVIGLVKTHFGTWKGGPAPLPPEPPHPAFAARRLVFPDPSFYQGVGLFMSTWRGPDVLRQTRDTYVADVLLFLLSSPVGRFKQSLFDKVPGLYDPEYISFSYPTQRDGGQFIFSTFFTYDPRNPTGIPGRMEGLEKAFMEEMAIIAKDPAAYFGAEELELAKTKLSDQNLMAMETASSVLSTLNFWWATASTDYFFKYETNCRKVSFDDIAGLLRTWILDKPQVSALRIRADMLAADTTADKDLKRLSYEVVGPDSAYWWQSAPAAK